MEALSPNIWLNSFLKYLSLEDLILVELDSEADILFMY